MRAGGLEKLGVEPLSVCNRARLPQIVYVLQPKHVKQYHFISFDYIAVPSH
jgi:hypothetical protein